MRKIALVHRAYPTKRGRRSRCRGRVDVRCGRGRSRRAMRYRVGSRARHDRGTICCGQDWVESEVHPHLVLDFPLFLVPVVKQVAGVFAVSDGMQRTEETGSVSRRLGQDAEGDRQKGPATHRSLLNTSSITMPSCARDFSSAGAAATDLTGILLRRWCRLEAEGEGGAKSSSPEPPDAPGERGPAATATWSGYENDVRWCRGDAGSASAEDEDAVVSGGVGLKENRYLGPLAESGVHSCDRYSSRGELTGPNAFDASPRGASAAVGECISRFNV